MRVLIEALHIAAGMSVALLIAAVGSWAYPLARGDLWTVSLVAIGCIALMGIAPIRRAIAADRAARAGEGAGVNDA